MICFSSPDTEFASYADTNTLYYVENVIEDKTLSLRDYSKKLYQWISDNQLRGNSDKYNLKMQDLMYLLWKINWY